MPKRTPRNVEALAAFVRRLQKDKDLSAREIARRSGRAGTRITHTYVGSILNGTAKNLTIRTLEALAVGLDEPFETVLFAAAGINPASKDAFKDSIFYLLWLKTADEGTPEDERRMITELAELLNERLKRKDVG